MPGHPLSLALAHQAAAAGHGSVAAQSVSATSLLVQMVIGLAVIIVLIKVASRFVQSRGGRTVGRRSRPCGITLVGRQSLGKGVQVAMVHTGTQAYLLGVTQHQVTLLGQLDTGDVVPAAGTDADAGLQLLRGGDGAATADGGPLPVWRSTIEQMRVRTVRRA